MSPRPSARSVIVTLMLLAVAIGVLWYLRMPTALQLAALEPSSMGANPEPVVDDLGLQFADIETVAETPASAVQATSSSTAQVPLGLPLAAVAAQLAEQADRGDAVAACRLALERLYCAEDRSLPPQVVEGLSGQVSEMEAQPQSAMIDYLALSQTRTDQRLEHCEGVADEPEQIEKRARQAAQHGSVRMRVLYALRAPEGALARLAPRMGFTLGIQTVHSVSQFYALNAHAYLQQGLQAHDLLALEGMVLLHAPGDLFGSQMLPIQLPNPLRYAVLSGLYAELLPDQGLPPSAVTLRESALAQLSPAQREHVERLIEQEVRAWQTALRGRSAPPRELDASSVQSLCTDA